VPHAATVVHSLDPLQPAVPPMTSPFEFVATPADDGNDSHLPESDRGFSLIGKLF